MKSPSGPSKLDPVNLTAELQRTFASPSYRPPTLPAVAMEVMDLTSQADVRLGELAAVLQRDPVLAARALSISQSAAYASRSPPVTLQQAVVRLGLGALREIVVEAALAERVFRAPGHEELMARLALHSTACAHVTRLVLRELHREVDHGFLCGLLHDIGIAAALLASADRPEWRRVPVDVLARVLDAVHVDASGVVATLWKLPEPIRRVVGSHHEVVVDGKPALVNAALVVAEQLCWEAGGGMLPPPSDADPTSAETPEPPWEGLDVNWPEVFGEARNALGIDHRQLSSTRAKAFTLVASLIGEGAGYAA